ncbi:hypothetical protein Goklo_024978 [Gossypium klotzschianum]|uniref:RNase H type-1 domain-containing protein n=1 Tax=Gossypium klotzschianum TaxID=34286 RepID=A0A7J8WE24_9ROSI|nr:hypothetical protein [Gossypium klotzschianum]
MEKCLGSKRSSREWIVFEGRSGIEYLFGMTCGYRDSITWKAEMNANTFSVDIVRKILPIPLARAVHDDVQVWRGEPSGEFSVKSAYKLLQEANSGPSNNLIQTEIKDFYKKLGNLQLLSKIKIALVHEGKVTSRRGISKQIQSYIAELDGPEEKKLTVSVDGEQRHPTRNMRVTIYFNATFDRHSSRAVSGLVVRDLGGKILASKTVIHSAISSPFATEAHARGFKNSNKEMSTLDPDESVIETIIRDIQSKKVHFQETNFIFISRSANEYAHILAHEALKMGEGEYLVGAVPDYIRHELKNRRPMHPD